MSPCWEAADSLCQKNEERGRKVEKILLPLGGGETTVASSKLLIYGNFLEWGNTGGNSNCRWSDKTSAEKTFTEIYCFITPKHCEILKRFGGDQSVPDNMLPDGTIQSYEDSREKLAAIAEKIANSATEQLKNSIEVINELPILKQDEIKEVIRNAAMKVLKQDKIAE